MKKSIRIEKTQYPKQKPDSNNLGFGKIFSDHMFIMDYEESKGWYDPRIIPYQPLILDPATMVLHYGQGIFEGLKAYKSPEEKVLLFRPEMNMRRINDSKDRICLPEIDEDFCLNAIKTLVNLDKDWIPKKIGTSLYIRPFIFATDPHLGVHPSLTYKFIIILSPSGSYYPQGVNPVNIFVEEYYVRSIKGGTGNTKTIGNYAASLRAQKLAAKKGYIQVLWLDAIEKKYIEEVGAMNVFFKIAGEVITPSLLGTILSGITRNSTIQLLKKWNIKITERKISINEVFEAYNNGTLEEVFGTGTAAVISPIGELNWHNNRMIINNNETGKLASRLYNEITNIQNGIIDDYMNWTVEVK